MYHGGKGSDCRILRCSDARDSVSWKSRWRVCSRALMSSGVGVAMLELERDRNYRPTLGRPK